MQRILTLTFYFVKNIFRSLTGIGLVLASLVFWAIFFNPGQKTPDAAYYMLVIGCFGAGMAFFVTLACASRANHAELYPWIIRLPSRVEYMTAVFCSSLIITAVLQLLVAILALFNGPQLTAVHLLEIPPVWASLAILGAVLSLHATDLVVSGWSRVYIFGLLAIVLFAQSIHNTTMRSMVVSLNRVASSQGWTSVNEALADYAIYLNDGDNVNIISRFFGLIFWPFKAIADGIVSGSFTPAQALAPAILLLYATILFMLAADFFASKDLTFTE